MTGLDNDDRILEEGYRKQVIDEMINSRENLVRKNQELKKHEVFKEMSLKWVLHGLRNENYRKATLYRMGNRATNIPIAKKIVKKLSQTYSGGVSRSVESDESLLSIESLSDEMDFDSTMVKVDRYRNLFQNCQLFMVPIKSPRPGEDEGKYTLKPRVLAPYEYDVIEDANDHTMPRVLLLTPFTEQTRMFTYDYESELQGSRGFHKNNSQLSSMSDNKQQMIADSPADEGKDDRQVIWWSHKYHFTTDMKGTILREVSPDDLMNPIGMMPSVNITKDQDGHFWASGGDSIVDGDILINKIMTDINFLAMEQGWGQMVITGKDIPNKLEGGPDRALLLAHQEDDPTPSVYFASSSPMLSDMQNQVKNTLAMLLSSNDLSPKNISANLDATNMASGIALLIEQSEIMTDIQESQNYYGDKEPEFWEVTRRWHSLYSEKKLLVSDYQEISKFEDSNVKLEFHQIKPPVSEKERLETLEKKKKMGVISQRDLIKEEGGLTDEEAESRLSEIEKEKKKNAEAFGVPIAPGQEVNGDENDGEQPDETEDEGENE